MAIQTKTLGVLVDETSGTQAELIIQWDDATLRLTLVRVVNPTTFPATVTARRAAGGGQTYSLTAPAGQTVEQAIPGNAAARLSVTIDARGRVDGVEWNFGFGLV